MIPLAALIQAASTESTNLLLLQGNLVAVGFPAPHKGKLKHQRQLDKLKPVAIKTPAPGAVKIVMES